MAGGAARAMHCGRVQAAAITLARRGCAIKTQHVLGSPPLTPTIAGPYSDADFDPMGWSNIEDFDWSGIVVPAWFNKEREGISTLYWMREAELKHGRICMLATLGWVATDLGFRFPGEAYSGISTLAAHDAMVKNGNMGFLLTVIFVIEILSGAAIYEAAKGSGRAPGDYGFDPLGLGRGNDAKKADYALKEIKNARLAMLGFSGIVTQAALTGHSFPYQ
uniref:Uncharacterized protein n=1 Tax=Phaeomonas parva TaxID=124430 RepID=A0A6U4LBX8_9STRA|mmetsp:Transcript_9269/g.27207  ORF Transcript_9269/g.27207 Transcript_9269/m.27207 type:complete len:220 (+) Transcript_9269:73-732(+)